MRLSCDIKCPSCSGLATFHEPFEFHSSKTWVSDGRPEHRWGSWVVVEKFPGTMTWEAPKTSRHFLEHWSGESSGSGYRVLAKGVSVCGDCHTTRRHELNWPQDAYWTFTVRGKTLWAWDREHVERIRDFVSQKIRPSRRSPELRYIPSHFFLSKNRKDLLARLDRALAARS